MTLFSRIASSLVLVDFDFSNRPYSAQKRKSTWEERCEKIAFVTGLPNAKQEN
jgi:hypothetical protein